MPTILDVRDLRHRYGSTIALDGVDLQVDPGECVALLGPNGAGKTTLVDAVIGLRPATAGTVSVLGGDPRTATVRRNLGVVQQQVGFPDTLTVVEVVRGAAVRAGAAPESADEALITAGIDELAGRRAAKLSGGQQQRLQLAAALVADPALLVLDEPTEGLDTTARRAFWHTLASRRDRGVGVLLTTHLIDEAAAVADRVVLLHQGRVVATGTPSALSGQLTQRTVVLRTRLTDIDVAELDAEVRIDKTVADTAADGHDRRWVHLTTAAPERLLYAVQAADPDYDGLRVEGASLEDALVYLTEQADAPAAEPAAA